MASPGSAGVDGKTSETSSIATTIVPLSQVASSGGSILLQRPVDNAGNDVTNPPSPPQHDEWIARVDEAFWEAEDLVFPYRGKKVSLSTARNIRVSADSVTKVFRQGFKFCDKERQDKITEYRGIIANICSEMEELSFEKEED
jgi:hypothetical protein